MSTQLPVNRVERDLNKWRSREERFSKLFSFDLSGNKALMREKLQYYDNVAARYKSTSNPEERYVLRALKQERRQVAKKAYPNAIVRFLRWTIVPLRQRQVVKKETKQTETNLDALKDKLERVGFGDAAHKLEQHVRQGQSAFSIPLSRYPNENERLDYSLTFTQAPNGTYQLDGFKASLHHEQNPETWRQQYFDLKAGTELSMTHVHNLLAGRAVLQQQPVPGGTPEDKWVQLDFTEKDGTNNFKIREFDAAYGDELLQSVQRLPLKELESKQETEKLMEGLKNGNRQSVSVQKDGEVQQLYLETNPRHRSISIYDQDHNRIRPSEVLGLKASVATEVTNKMAQGRKPARIRPKGRGFGH